MFLAKHKPNTFNKNKECKNTDFVDQNFGTQPGITRLVPKVKR